MPATERSETESIIGTGTAILILQHTYLYMLEGGEIHNKDSSDGI